jgi:glutamine synthetase
MTEPAGTTGRTNLADRAGVDDTGRREAVRTVVAEVESRGLHSIRLAFADAHGLLRGKTVDAALLAGVFENGVGATSALLLKDTGQINALPVWQPGAGIDEPAMTGAGDVLMLPDPHTFRILPWAPGTGWLICDLFTPAAQPVDIYTRRICADAEQRLAAEGYEFRAGLEMEFHLYRVDDPNRGVGDPRGPADRLDLSHSHLGYVYLGEQRFDQIEELVEPIRRHLTELGLAPRSMELELGPSQVEMTFSPAGGLNTADQAVLLRSAVKQISHRHGLHATFMSRPVIAGSFSSGWHLHQSLVDRTSGRNLFSTPDDDELLSPLGGRYLAGLLAHAPESCLLTTPTVTGYKRYRPMSLAPDRIAWGREHRGAMLRIIGAPDDPATRIENRVGDSAANPYLYLASQMLSGLDGIHTGDDPPPPTETPYDAEAGPRLPRDMGQAIGAFGSSDFYRRTLGSEFVDYLVTLKRSEWERYSQSVTDWEQGEYFELY